MNSLLTSLRSLLLIAAFAFVVVACKKDSDPEPTATGIEGSWNIKSASATPSTSLTAIFAAEIEASSCKSQVVFNFKTGGAIEVTYPSTCEDDVESLSNFIDEETKWSVKNTSTLVLTDSDGVTTEAALKFNGSEMTWTATMPDITGTATLTLVFTKK
jgi:hypothetical protein